MPDQLSYRLHLPARCTSSVVFSSPHSGRDYGSGFLARTILNKRQVRSSEDAYVDQLFDAAPRHGAPLITARAPRAFVDLNRSAEELDPALIEDVRRVSHNPRISSGLGVIPRVVSNGRAIYSGKIPRAEAEDRITRYWRPYHDRLQRLLTAAHHRFGQAILIDCHSMPHEAIEGYSQGSERPQVVLGDRFGAAADGEIVERVEAIFAGAGLTVTRNAPFAGAYITQHYGRPSRGQHVVQVEIDRALYLDESQVRPNERFNAFNALMDRVTAEIADMGRGTVQLAAE